MSDSDSLLDRLRRFRFASAGRPPFADALARATGWSAVVSQRVVEEYRRFLWLAGTATEVVSPSPAVDRAWHLHLLDTRSYWDELCARVLQRPLHHEASDGSLVARRQLKLAYARTWTAYRAAFGDPPADLWPDPDEPQPPPISRVRRSAAIMGHLPWIALGALPCLALIPALPWRRLVAAWLGAPALVGYLVPGVLLAALLMWQAARRRRADNRLPAIASPDLVALDRHDIGYLARGPRGAIEVAVTELVAAGELVPDARGLRETRSPAQLPQRSNPLRSLVRAAIARRPDAALADQLPPQSRVQTLLEPDLAAANLLVPQERHTLVDRFTGVACLALGVLFGIKVVLSPNGSPMKIGAALIPLFALTALAASLGTTTPGARARSIVTRLRAAFALPDGRTRAADDYAELVARFGPDALRGSSLDDLATLLAPPQSESPGCGGCGG
jgi:uncharacterized protein (TIGR04222 family)